MQTNRNDFFELLQRYIDGSCSSEEKQMMDHWYELLNQEHEEKTASLSRNQLEDLLWAKIQHRTQAEKETNNQWRQHDG